MKTLRIIIGILIGISVFFIARNHFVCEFRTDILDMCLQKKIRDVKKGEYWTSYYKTVYKEMPSYDVMLFSVKPMTMENWLTEEQINALK